MTAASSRPVPNASEVAKLCEESMLLDEENLATLFGNGRYLCEAEQTFRQVEPPAATAVAFVRGFCETETCVSTSAT